MTDVRWSHVEQELVEAGYEPDPPAAGWLIDKPIAEEAVCHRCGGSRHYRGYTIIDPPSYRAFSICLRCDLADEF